MPTPSVLDKVRKDGVIHVGFQRHTPPFSYCTQPSFVPQGYSVDLFRQVMAGICRRHGIDSCQIRAVEVTSSTRLALLEDGSIDIECGSTTITPERKTRNRFSRPIFFTSHRILVKSTVLSSAGKPKGAITVVGIQGSTSHAALMAWPSADVDYRFCGSANIASAFKSFCQDEQVDAIVADEVILKALMLNAAIADVQLLPHRIGGEPYGFMIRLGDSIFQAEVDVELERLMAVGPFETTYATWFTGRLPSMGFDLNIPLTGEMRERLNSAQ
ncbi:transporter substrate-binding domain-containing protein [Marinobacterium sp. D7]|uniref:transporter substrate-binding domain-containing protein n=1 Tax=Marinobacterium ramblicola TaxID=2849041 RepID=UPI001C2D7421|nr:transporter substrate-binding domain-containing protein [Marinobacterium ramblicola]MBV1787467.1 transporter substrate-binding domain-containing protein [Marinobacterium ramblicola]